MVTRALTLAEIAELPAVTDLVTAGRALGIGRTRAYELARAGQFPCPVIRAGTTWRVPTAGLLALLGLPVPGPPPPGPARPPRLTGGGEPRVHAPRPADSTGTPGPPSRAWRARPAAPTEEDLMSDGTTFKLCSCRDEATGKPLGRKCPKLRRGNALEPRTAPGTTRSSCRRAPTAPAAPRCATAASPLTPPPRPSWTWPGNCWPSPRPATSRRPSGSPTPSPPRCARPASSPTPTGSASRSAAATTPPSARPLSGSGSRSGSPPRRSFGPAPCAATRATSACTSSPTSGTSRSTGSGSPTSASVFDYIEELNDAITEARATGSPAARAAVKGRRLVGPATCQRIRATLRSAISTYMKQHPGTLPANVASLVELPPGGRPKALVWTGERVRAWQKDFDAAAGRRPQGGRAGQPGRHLDLRAPPVAGHGLDPRPDRRCSSKPPDGTGCTPCGGLSPPGDCAAARAAGCAAPTPTWPPPWPRSAGRSPSSAGTPSRAPPSPTPASAPSPSTPTPSPTCAARRRSRTRRKKPPATPGPTAGSSSPTSWAARCTPPTSPTPST